MSSSNLLAGVDVLPDHTEVNAVLKRLLEHVQWDARKLGHLGLNLVLPVLSHDTHNCLLLLELWPQAVTLTEEVQVQDLGRTGPAGIVHAGLSRRPPCPKVDFEEIRKKSHLIICVQLFSLSARTMCVCVQVCAQTRCYLHKAPRPCLP